MKYSISILHLLIGCALIFLAITDVQHWRKEANPSTSSGDSEWVVKAQKRMPLETASAASNIVIGIISLIGAALFLRDNRYAMWFLPTVFLGLYVRAVIMPRIFPQPISFLDPPAFDAIAQLGLFVAFVIEALYFIRIRRNRILVSQGRAL